MGSCARPWAQMLEPPGQGVRREGGGARCPYWGVGGGEVGAEFSRAGLWNFFFK